MHVDIWKSLEEIIGVLGLSLIAGIIFQRLGHTPLIGYLLVGVICGPYGLKIIKDDIASSISEIGIILLLFLLGLEFSPRRLKSLGLKVCIEGFFQIFLIVVVSILYFYIFFDKTLVEGWIIGSALALSSTAAALKFLLDRAEIDSQHGRIAVGILLFQDIAVIFLLMGLNSFTESTVGLSSIRLSLLLTIGKTFIFLLIIFLIYFAISKYILSYRGFYKNREHFVILALIMALGSAILAHRLDLNPSLGAFLSGLLVAEDRISHQLKGDMIPIQSIFLVIFFTSIGMMANLSWLYEKIFYVIFFLSSFIFIKFLFTFLPIYFSRRNVKSAVLSSLSLLSVSEFSFVVVSIAKEKNLIKYDIYEIIIISIVMSMLFFPIVFILAENILRRVHRLQFTEEMVIRQDRDDWKGHNVDFDDHYIVVGYGPVGKKVVDTLDKLGSDIVIIDLNPFHSTYIKETHKFIFGDMTSAEILLQAGIRKAKAIIITTPDMRSVMSSIAIIRSLNRDILIVCRAVFSFYVPQLQRAGADIIIDSEAIQGDEMAKKLIEALDISDEKTLS